MYIYIWASLVTQLVKNLPAMQKNQVQSLGQKGPLEKEMAIHSSTLVWVIPWTEDMAGYSPWDFKDSGTTVQLTFTFHIYINFFFFFFILSELVLVCQLFLLHLSHIFSMTLSQFPIFKIWTGTVFNCF